MRLVFLYLQHKRDGYFAERITQEGYYYLISRMVSTGIVDSALIVIDSGRNRRWSYSPKISGVSVAGLDKLNEHLEDGDVIWCRGGWRAWHNVLETWKGKHWMILYAANTGRERWKFWDIIFEDRQEKMARDRYGRFWFFFKKPTHPGIFKPLRTNEKMMFDLCIGASHIHDRKAQWKTVDAVLAYRSMYKENLRCIMPGGIRRGQKTWEMLQKIEDEGLGVDLVGEVSRTDLNEIMNRTRLFIHLGGHGQNDRGPLEAMRCGLPVIIESKKAHAPLVSQCPWNVVAPNPNDPEKLAMLIRSQLEACSSERRANVFDYHQEKSSVETVILPEMREIFSVIEKNPKPDSSRIAEHFGGQYRGKRWFV